MTEPAVRDEMWWLDEAPHAGLFAAVERIKNEQGLRDVYLRHCARLYGEVDDLGRGHSAAHYELHNPYAKRLGLNVVRSMVDAVVSEQAQSKPRPKFLTSGGDWFLQQKAKKLGKWCEGALSETRFDRRQRLCDRDAALFGTGILQVVEVFGRVRVENVPVNEVVVDGREAQYGEPRSLYRIRAVDRGVLLARYPGHDEAIEEARGPDGAFEMSHGDTTADQVLVLEAWHLRSGPDEDDGRYVVAVDQATLCDEAWEDDDFPFVFQHWTEPLRGFWGKGLGDILGSIQTEINRLVRAIQNAQRMAGCFRIWVPQGSGLTEDDFTSDNTMVRVFAGNQPPIFAPSSAVPPELYRALQDWYSKAYELAGVSQLSAQAQKPAGLDSGAALREYSDQKSVRFLAFGQAREETVVEVARKMIRAMRALAETDAKYDVVYRGKGAIERIDWKKVALDEDEYAIDVFPVSSLPNTPAGRLAALQDLFNAQLIDQESFRALADFPDLEAETSLELAPRNVIDQTLATMLDEGQYLSPESSDDLSLAMKRAALAYAKARVEGVPDERKELLRMYLEDCKSLLTPPPEPQPAGAASPPPNGPAGPPTGPGPALLPEGPSAPAGPLPPAAAPPVAA